MILETTYQLYQAFLDGIKKHGTGVVNPVNFNRLINEGQDEWVKTNVAQGVELTQDMQDRLSVLKIITDDKYMYSERIDGNDLEVISSIPNNIRALTYTSATGIDYTGATISPNLDNYFIYPLKGNVVIDESLYPEYLRLLSVQFKIEYVNNKCKEGTSDWLDASVLKTDNKSVIKKNPFRKPKDNRLYYEIVNNFFVLTTGTESTGHSMKLDYLRYPRKIFYNVNNNENINLEQDDVPDYTGIIPGSINCELPSSLRQEIVNTAIRVFIERIKDPRYQSYLNEFKTHK